MKLAVAKTGGFCFGVNRAVGIVYEKIEQNQKICMLGPIIHNPQVVKDLENKGAVVIDSLESIPDKEMAVVIRAHGVSQWEYTFMEEHGICYVDTTCPFVKKIHRIVREHDRAGEQVVIVGDRTHPEVIGINGWCGNRAVILDSPHEVLEQDFSGRRLCVVAQTTLNRTLWEQVLKALEPWKPLVFDTICNATRERQTEAEELAKKSDVMIVIGGKNSSNTKKLADICSKYCPTYLIEQADQLPRLPDGKIGITAGASTPAYIIKEVVHKMATENTSAQAELNFADELEKSFKTLNTGDIVRGTVISITPTEVYVDLGAKSDGFIPVAELSERPDVNPEDVVKVGDEIEVFVVRVNDVEGTIQLSKKKVASIQGWKEIEQAMDEGRDLKGHVIEVVNGGMIMTVNGVRVFIPASLANDRFMRDLTPLIGQELPVRIIDMNPKRHKVVGSVKAILMEEKEAKSKELWENIEIGKKYQGVVKSITNFGAFVDIGGVDGLIHISELSWKRIKHPSEVMKVGDIVNTYIIDFNQETGKISLGYRDPEDNPWKKVEQYKAGDVITCKVVRLVPFGAFVEVVPNADGLIHISQIADRRIGKPSDVLSVGQEVQAKILEIDPEKQKISLSIRALLEHTEPVPAEEEEEPVIKVAQAAESGEIEELPEETEQPAEEAVKESEEE